MHTLPERASCRSGGGSLVVAGLDLARRRDHSALVLLAVEPERLTVTAALRQLVQFVFKPGARGRLRLEAARGHDDLVIAAALAVLASDLVKVCTASKADVE